MVDCLNHWAHKVQRKPIKIAKKLRRQKIDMVITNEADLDAALAENSELAHRLPGDAERHRISAMMAKAPPPGGLQEGEIWALVNSGSGIDGANLSSICPEIKTHPAPRPIVCTAANGQEMVADKVAVLKVTLDGQESSIPFSDLPLEMPIVSVRQHVGSRKHTCRIQDGGGYFRNVETRKKSRFVEREGVYFMRMKILGQRDEGSTMPFGRPGVQA